MQVGEARVTDSLRKSRLLNATPRSRGVEGHSLMASSSDDVGSEKERFEVQPAALGPRPAPARPGARAWAK